MEILYKFINRIGHTSFLHVTSLENRYSIECMTGSIILLLMYCSLPGHKKYHIKNPIRRRFSYISMIEVGVHGFFTLICNTGDHKHGWIVVHHEENEKRFKLLCVQQCE